MTLSGRWWAFERGTLWALDLSGEDAPARPTPRAARFVEVEHEAADALAAAMDLPGPELVLQRIASRRRCFAAWVEDRIAAYGWVSQMAECIGELEREFHMRPGEAYIWNCATLPPYRRQGLYSALLSHIVSDLCREGVQRIWIGSSLANQPSLRGFAHAGFRPVVHVAYVRLIGLCALWIGGYAGAPDAWVAAAHRALTAAHERAWGALILGRTGATPLPACAQIEAG